MTRTETWFLRLAGLAQKLIFPHLIIIMAILIFYELFIQQSLPKSIVSKEFTVIQEIQKQNNGDNTIIFKVSNQSMQNLYGVEIDVCYAIFDPKEAKAIEDTLSQSSKDAKLEFERSSREYTQAILVQQGEATLQRKKIRADQTLKEFMYSATLDANYAIFRMTCQLPVNENGKQYVVRWQRRYFCDFSNIPVAPNSYRVCYHKLLDSISSREDNSSWYSLTSSFYVK